MPNVKLTVGNKMLSQLEPVLLIDSDGLSNYTCYLARGLSRYREIVLYSFSEQSYILTGAVQEKAIKFNYLKKRLPKGYSTLRGLTRIHSLIFHIICYLA